MSDAKTDKLVALHGRSKVLLALVAANHNVEFLRQHIDPVEGVEVFAIMAEYLRDLMARNAGVAGARTYAEIVESFDRVAKQTREALS